MNLLLDEQNTSVVCVDNFNHHYDAQLKHGNAGTFVDRANVTLVENDFCDVTFTRNLFAAEKFTHVVHLGAYAGVRGSVDQPEIYVRNNVEGTVSLLEACREFPVDRFVLVSSSTVYGRRADIPFREYNSLGIPASPYGASKRAAELMGMTYYELHNVPVVGIRPFSVYGPRMRPDLAISVFTRKILMGELLPLFGDGSFRRDMTHVSDVCKGLWAAMTRSNVVGERINLGCGNPIAMSDVIQTLADAVGNPAKIDYLPAREEDLHTTFADLTLAKRLLDFEPAVSFSTGAVDFVNWYRERHKL